MTAVILMYHRVVERAGAEPWFARGTAVEPDAFGRQMSWLVQHFEVVSLRRLLRDAAIGIDGARPRAAVTFDDGYQDVVRHALPVCQALGIVGAVFPVCPPNREVRTLWFDELYLILQAAFERARVYEAPPGPRARESGGRLVEGLSLDAWVRGEFKRSLQASTPEVRSRALAELALRLDVMPDSDDIYLSDDDLGRLVSRGWSVGGHGVSHSRLTMLSDERVAEEVRASIAFAASFDPNEPILAYPDGAHDVRVMSLARSCGVRWALTVEPAALGSGVEPLAVPRFLCRGDASSPCATLSALVQGEAGLAQASAAEAFRT